MSDAEKIQISTETSSSSPRNPLLIIGGVGCALLLCAALFIGGGIYFAGDRLNTLAADWLEQQATKVATTPVVPLTPSPGPVETTPTTESTAESEATGEPTQAPLLNETPVMSPATTLTAITGPEFSPITFALGATDEYEPINPGVAFEEGLTEIHAIFDYSGMSSDYTWERVWYLNGDEILRSGDQWNGDQAGRFDYFIDAGGAPLSSGEWLLELYVEGELLAEGGFVIEPEQTQIAPVSQTAEPPSTQTATPVPSPIPQASQPVPTPTEETLGGGGTYQLAFTRWDGGNHNIYIADTAGNNEQLLVTRGAGPSWTPDGQYLFFYGEEGVDRQIRNEIEYVNPNYSVSNGIIRLTMIPFPADVTQLNFYQGPGWNEGTARWANVAPNGEMVAFDARPGGGGYRVFFLGTEGNQQYQYQLLGEQADWSPDSQKVVYRSGRDGRTGLWISNRDDTGHFMITDGGSDSFPTWSPDGKIIVFSRDAGGDVNLFAINPDGSNLRQLTNAPGPDTLPEFTPSGDIIFRSARDGGWGIWKMRADGSNPTLIIPNVLVGPDWSYSRLGVGKLVSGN